MIFLAGVRGIGGVKKPLNVNELPSYKHKNTYRVGEQRQETEEEKLKRHQEFFNQMRDIFNKK